jgi:sensor histidine kinase YesM
VDPGVAPPAIGRASIREIDSLNKSFRAMYEKLRVSTLDLVETRSEETKSRMLALQSLMNPHFVYNSIAAIGAMADEGLVREVKAMCEDLSQILRYVSSSAEGGVPLRDEIEHTEKYLKCMKVRFGDSLSYGIEVPESMLALTVPKLVVQPLAENSIKHGFNVCPPWHLTIRGFEAKGGWRIEVADDGIGFDPEALGALRARIGERGGPGEFAPIGIEGSGLLNIVLRLRLLYGDDYAFEVAERPEGGARVTIGGRVDGR